MPVIAKKLVCPPAPHGSAFPSPRRLCASCFASHIAPPNKYLPPPPRSLSTPLIPSVSLPCLAPVSFHQLRHCSTTNTPSPPTTSLPEEEILESSEVASCEKTHTKTHDVVPSAEDTEAPDGAESKSETLPVVPEVDAADSATAAAAIDSLLSGGGLGADNEYSGSGGVNVEVPKKKLNKKSGRKNKTGKKTGGTQTTSGSTPSEYMSDTTPVTSNDKLCGLPVVDSNAVRTGSIGKTPEASAPSTTDASVESVGGGSVRSLNSNTLAQALRFNNFALLQQDLPLIEPPTVHVMLSTQGRRHITATIDTTDVTKSRMEYSSYLLINHADPDVKPTLADGFGPDVRAKKVVLIASTGFWNDPAVSVAAVEAVLKEQHCTLGEITHVFLPSVDLGLLTQGTEMKQLFTHTLNNPRIVIPSEWSEIFVNRAAFDQHISIAVEGASVAERKRVPVQRVLSDALKAYASSSLSTSRGSPPTSTPDQSRRAPVMIQFPDLPVQAVHPLALGDTFTAVPWRPLRYAAQGRDCALLDDQATDSVFVDAALGRFVPWLTHVPHRIALAHEESQCVIPCARSDHAALGRPRELGLGVNVARDYLGLVQHLRKKQWSRLFTHSFGMSEFGDETLRRAEQQSTAILRVMDAMHAAIMRDGALQCDTRRFARVLERKVLDGVLFKDGSFPAHVRSPTPEMIRSGAQVLTTDEAAAGDTSSDPAVLAVLAAVRRDVVPGLFRFALGMRKPHFEETPLSTDPEPTPSPNCLPQQQSKSTHQIKFNSQQQQQQQQQQRKQQSQQQRGVNMGRSMHSGAPRTASAGGPGASVPTPARARIVRSPADETGLVDLFERNGLGLLVPVLVKEDIDMSVFQAMPKEDLQDVFKATSYGHLKKLQQLQLLSGRSDEDQPSAPTPLASPDKRPPFGVRTGVMGLSPEDLTEL